MKRTLSLILSVIMLCASFTFVANAAGETYAPEVGDGYIRFDASTVIGGTVNHVNSANIERNVMFEGKNAIKFTPTPTTEGAAKASGLNIDCYSLANYDTKVEVPKYKYVAVEYYYDTDNPSFTDKPWFSFLPGKYKATGNLSAYANSPIETNKWATAYFSFATTMKVNETDTPWINQVHFRPFPGISASSLSETDVIYIASYTFYENNPDPNSSQTIEFLKGNPDAVGEKEPLTVKTGEKYTIPSSDYITFPNHDAVFIGWLCSTDKKTYQPGQEIVAGDGTVIYTAQWNVSNNEEFISLNFVDYQNGIVNRMATGTVEETVEDGKTVVKVKPNPEAEDGKKFTIDGFQYASAGIDLDVFHWIGIEYKYVSENPVDARMYTAIMRNGNIFPAGKGASAESLNKLVTNQWSTAWFDYTMLPEILDPENPNHTLRQMHIRPFGNGNLYDFSADDTMYISRVMFFREKPDLHDHKAYMTGYNDATFKPNKTMTRAEACTVVARLIDTEENIAKHTATAFADVATDKWYAKYISFCEAKGLLKSYSGTFAPEQNITRAEFAELVYNMGLAKEDPANKKTFTDVTAAHPKYAAIMAAASAGLIGGYSDGTFLPDRTITRAQVVTIINRAKGISKTADKVSSDLYTIFLDVDGTHWAFADIAEATINHTEMDGSWAYYGEDPLNAIIAKVGEEKLFDIEAGNAKVAELDALEAKRIEEIRSTPNMDLSTLKGKKIYVSSSMGDDANDGLSEEKPFKSINRALVAASTGDAVLLKRGDMWRGNFALKENIILSAYGEGEKPIINGSPESGADPAKWSLVYKNDETGAKIWKYANEKFYDIGVIVFNGDEGYAYKEVPSSNGSKFYVRGGDKTVEYDYTKELDRNFEFFHKANSSATERVINPSSAVGPLYLRCDNGNPGEIFDSIEFNQHGNTIYAKSGNIIDNICIKHPGSHGIGMGTIKNVLVQNCELAWIGGSVQTYDYHGAGGPATRFGNGVEVYGGCDGYTVNNCYIWQNYDAGVTHQYAVSAAGDCDMSNVVYSNNVITDTVYSVEYFLGEADGVKRTGKNILIENNLMRRAGFGFGSTRPDGHNQGHIRSGGTSNPFENFVIRNNIFDRSVQYLVQAQTSHAAYMPKMEGNTYIQGKDNHAFTFGVPSIKIYADLGAPGRTKGFLGDSTGTFYYVDNIPYYEFKFDYTVKSDKEYPVVGDNTSAAEPATPSTPSTPAQPEVQEEIKAPFFVRTAEGTENKDVKTKLYGDLRASMNPEIKVDSDTGAKYLHVTINNTSNSILLDCHGLNPVIPIEENQVVIKALVRTNHSAKPSITFYHIKDKDGTEISGKNFVASGESLKADGKWEEIYVVAKDLDESFASAGQIHLFPWGSGVKGQSFYNEDGSPKQADLFIDFAAWAAFPNLSSAKAYDLSADVGASSSLVGSSGSASPSNAVGSDEISAPYFVRTAIGSEKNDNKTKLFADARASMNNTIMTDSQTGYKFMRTTLNPTSNSILYDAFGLSPIPLTNGKVAFKVLIRTNYSAKPSLNYYTIKDANSEILKDKSFGASGKEALVADEKWHEVIITADNIDSSFATSSQIHFMPWGGAVKGNSFFDEEGNCLTNPEPYFDVAAWAVFPNEASAKAYDLSKDSIEK